jgi:hypothetical protein
VRIASGHALRAALVVVLAALAWILVRLSDPALTPHDDFISSWAAGRLNATGHDPYDPVGVLAVQQTAGWTKPIPYRIWYPPWAMPLLAPFGLLPYATGRLLWFALHIGACLVSADLLWRYYGGDARSRGLSWVVLSTFWPALIEVRTGQISALILLGLVGFLHLVRARRWAAAGACLPLVAIKPVLLHLLWIAVLLWVVAERRWRVVLGAAATALALVALAVVSNPPVVAQFVHMALHDAPQPLVSTPGTVLRLAVAAGSGRDAAWLAIVPPLAGTIWLAFRWRRREGGWNWRDEMPVLLLASLLTTAYGWIYDDIVLLVPVMQVAVALLAGRARTSRAVIVGSYLLLNAGIVAMNVVRVEAFWYVWVPLAFAAWYAIARVRTAAPQPAAAAA